MSRRRTRATATAARSSTTPPQRAFGAGTEDRSRRELPRISTTIVEVAGMTCRSCENRIARHVTRIPGVTAARASAVRGSVEIDHTRRISPAAIERAITSAGYSLGRSAWISDDKATWITFTIGVFAVFVFLRMATLNQLPTFAAGVGDLSSGGLVVALLLGITAGVSTCAALVGGLVLALSAASRQDQADDDGHRPLTARLRPALVFVAGRIAGYALFGAALGALGASVTMPPQLTALLMAIVAIVMTILGTRLTGLSPRIAAWSPTLPMGPARRLGIAEGGPGAYSDGRAAALGAASFFLPCGFTQAIQIYALSTGSPLFAGTILAVFAIGTAPGLLALAGIPAIVPSRVRPTLMRLVGVVVIGFAVVNASSAVRLSGIDFSVLVPGAEAAALPPSGEISGGIQTLNTTQNAGGYAPGNVSIYAGVPTKWTITSTSTASCAASLVVPDLGIQTRLHVGANEIDLPALQSGRLYYSCAMGMYGGVITIVDRPSDAGVGG